MVWPSCTRRSRARARRPVMTDAHEEVQSLIAAYAMGAVPEDEIPAIRAHILSCEICFAEAESYTDVLSALATSVPPVPLPAGLAERVVAEARGSSRETVSEAGA